MNSKIRIESKLLLSGNNARLFLISFFSLILRSLLLFTISISSYLLFFSDNTEAIVMTEISIPSVAVKALIFTTTSIASLYLIFGIKNCESYFYFIAAKGIKPRLKSALRKATPKFVFKSLILFIKTFVLKLFWAVFYTLPWGICLAILTYMYTKSTLPYSIFMVLSFGTSLIFSLCIFMYKATIFRYSLASYYILFNKKEKVNTAIKKSLKATDKHIQNTLLLKASLIGWILSCALIIPIPYVLPYYKLCNASFLYYRLSEKEAPKEAKGFAINYLRLEKNQESI